MWELEYKGSWAPKNWCFWTVVLEKTLESPLICKVITTVNPKGNQSWRLMFGHLMRRTCSLAKTMMLGKIEGQRRRGQQRMRWWDGITDSTDMNFWSSFRSWWWTGKTGMLQSMRSQRVRHKWATELNSPLYVYTTLCLSIHLSMNTGVASTFWLWWIIFKILLSIIWVYIKKQLWYHVKK